MPIIISMAKREVNNRGQLPKTRGDEEQFYLYFRVTPGIYNELLRLVGSSLRRKDPQLRSHSSSLFNGLSFIRLFLCLSDTSYNMG